MAAKKNAKTAQKTHVSNFKPRKCANAACGVVVTSEKDLRTSVSLAPKTTSRGGTSMKTVKQHGCKTCISTVAAK